MEIAGCQGGRWDRVTEMLRVGPGRSVFRAGRSVSRPRRTVSTLRRSVSTLRRTESSLRRTLSTLLRSVSTPLTHCVDASDALCRRSDAVCPRSDAVCPRLRRSVSTPPTQCVERSDALCPRPDALCPDQERSSATAAPARPPWPRLSRRPIEESREATRALMSPAESEPPRRFAPLRGADRRLPAGLVAADPSHDDPRHGVHALSTCRGTLAIRHGPREPRAHGSQAETDGPGS